MRPVVATSQRVLDAIVSYLSEQLHVAQRDTEQRRGGTRLPTNIEVVLRRDDADDAERAVSDQHCEARVTALQDAVRTCEAGVWERRHLVRHNLDFPFGPPAAS